MTRRLPGTHSPQASPLFSIFLSDAPTEDTGLPVSSASSLAVMPSLRTSPREGRSSHVRGISAPFTTRQRVPVPLSHSLSASPLLLSQPSAALSACLSRFVGGRPMAVSISRIVIQPSHAS